jgi:hypothetical protein
MTDVPVTLEVLNSRMDSIEKAISEWKQICAQGRMKCLHDQDNIYDRMREAERNIVATQERMETSKEHRGGMEKRLKSLEIARPNLGPAAMWVMAVCSFVMMGVTVWRGVH